MWIESCSFGVENKKKTKQNKYTGEQNKNEDHQKYQKKK